MRHEAPRYRIGRQGYECYSSNGVEREGVTGRIEREKGHDKGRHRAHDPAGGNNKDATIT